MGCVKDAAPYAKGVSYYAAVGIGIPDDPLQWTFNIYFLR